MKKDKNETLEQDFLQVDPLKPAYLESIVEHPAHFETLAAKHTALLIIDMQYLDAAQGHGIFADAAKSGVPLEAQEYYFCRLKNTVIPNIQKLQSAFRKHGLEVIHTRIQSLTKNGRDRGPSHKRLGLFAPPGSRDAEFLPEVGPVGDEIVINKTASGVFNSTNLYYVLRNLKIDGLFIVGVYTNECVSTTVVDASDLGFFVTLIEDACATVTPKLQEHTVTVLRDRYSRVQTTEESITEIENLMESK